jgi:hypothetical protein
MTKAPTPNLLAGRSLRAPVLWGVVWGVIGPLDEPPRFGDCLLVLHGDAPCDVPTAMATAAG